MKYTKKSFTVGALPTEKYRSEWDRIFKPPTAPQPIDGRSRGKVDDHSLCDHCKAQNVDTYHKGGLFLCTKCAGLPPKVPAFWTCPDCGGTSSWGAEQLHRCTR